MFKHSDGWTLNARILRLYNDHHESGMASKSQHTRESTIRLKEIVETEIAQDDALVWC